MEKRGIAQLIFTPLFRFAQTHASVVNDMKNALHVMNAGGYLSPVLESEVRRVAQAALGRHSQRLELSGVDVALYVSPWTLPETGVGGYAPLGHWIQVTLTPDNPQFAHCWQQELSATLAHELHHAKRWQGPGYGRTLLEVLVSEGLAQSYEQVERQAAPPYARALPDMESLWQRAVPLLNSADYGHAAWFYGSEAMGLPRWTGYALGFELVSRYLAWTSSDAVTQVFSSAEDFRGAWDKNR